MGPGIFFATLVLSVKRQRSRNIADVPAQATHTKPDVYWPKAESRTADKLRAEDVA